MPERGHPVRWLVPEPLRTAAFDPTLADLEQDRAARTAGHVSAWRRAAAAWWFHAAVLAAAIECRRLAAQSRLEGHDRHPRERTTMTVLHDIHRAVRRLQREPMFLAVTVVTLALGISANLTVAGLANGLLLAPIDAPRPDELVRVFEASTSEGSTVTSFPNYVDVREATTTLDLAAHAQTSAAVGAPGTSELRPVELVTGNYFRVLGLAPERGRLIDERDDGAELAHPVVVVSDDYWRTHLGATSAAVGESLLVNSTPFEIVGVAPAGYHGTYSAHRVDLWVPLTMQQQVRPRGLTLDRRGWGWLSMIGRLRSGRSLVAVEGQLAQAAASINALTPGVSASQAVTFEVAPATAVEASDRRAFEPALTMVFAFTVLLFLVTCANLAGVMQSRVLARRRELAIRQSLGARRSRIVVEWLAECLVLAVAGGLLGWLMSRAVTAGLTRLDLPQSLVGSLQVSARYDARFALYALGLTMLAGVLFGLVPALRAGSTPPLSLIKDEGGAVAGGRRGARLRRGMIFVEVAVLFVLLLASGLLVLSLGRQLSADPGFDPAPIGLISLQRGLIPKAEGEALMTRALDRLRSEPGVVDAAVGMNIPLNLGHDRLGISVPGYVGPDGRSRVSVDYNLVSATYFHTMGIPFQAGGSWVPGAMAGVPVVVNETFARRFWPGRPAVGQTIQMADGPAASVVGVVRDVAYYAVNAAPIPYFYLPAELQLPDVVTIHVRTAGDPAGLLRRLEVVLSSVDRRLAASSVMTFAELRRVPLFPARLLATTAGVFGLLALLLTAVGLYGLVAHAVGRRTREIGLRMALGARPADVVGRIVRDALSVVVLGLLVGLGGGYLMALGLESWLTGVQPLDPAVTATVAGGLAACAAVAAWLPARRAAAIDPVRALRE